VIWTGGLLVLLDGTPGRAHDAAEMMDGFYMTPCSCELHDARTKYNVIGRRDIVAY